MATISRCGGVQLHYSTSSSMYSSLTLLIRPAAVPQRRSVLPSFTSSRSASHAAQGRANGPKNGPGKRLGLKKAGGELVVPGNIIYRQRGTLWFPGENVGMGRDHTLFAEEKGYVRYYSDPAKPKKRFVGIVFEKHQTLPTPPNAPRRRRLNMVAIPRKPEREDDALGIPVPKPVGAVNGELPEAVRNRRILQPGDIVGTRNDGTPIKMRSNYSFRESNTEIGRAAERAGITAKPFKKRWMTPGLLPRVRKARRARRKAAQAILKKSKKVSKKSNKKAKAKA